MGTILILFAVGLFLLLVEIYFTPGASVFGILGLVAIVAANLLAFRTLDSTTAWIGLFVSFFLTCIFLFALFKMMSSKRFSMTTEITEKVNVIPEGEFTIGQEGVTTTALRPEGNAMINGKVHSVYSYGDYIEPDTPIIISKITSDKLFVKPLKEL